MRVLEEYGNDTVRVRFCPNCGCALEASMVEQAVFSPEQAAKHLGVSESTVRRRIRDGQLKAVQPGGPGSRILISREALHRFV